MYKKIILFLSIIIGLSFGVTFGPIIWENLSFNVNYLQNLYLNAIIFGLLFALLGGLLAPFVEKAVRRLMEQINRLTISQLILGLIGTFIGLVIGYLIALPFASLNIPFISSTLPFVLSIILALVGYNTITNRSEEITHFFQNLRKENGAAKEANIQLQAEDGSSQINFCEYKILDTSVIIDGRIADIIETGFVEGTLVIPNFVLRELQFIADSSDSLKRAKGRRGFDILNELQNKHVQIEYYEGDFEDIDEVDSKLVRLAKIMNAAIVTNDYNLNKVAEFQKIPIFNINALANAVKPVLIPGEEMTVLVIKVGTERKQGVAYLDDGTMIVVEDGQYHMNERIKVVVTSAIQTAAGRMIFTKPVLANGNENEEKY